MDFERSRMMNNISALIKEKGLKVGELENKVGISAGYISKMTKAESESMPGIDLIYKLSQELEVSVEALVCGDFNKSNDNLLFLIRFLHSLEEDINLHRHEWQSFETYGALQKEYSFPDLPMMTRTLEVNLQQKESAFQFVSDFKKDANLTVTKDNFCGFVPELGVVLLFKLDNHLPEGRKTEFEMYVIEDRGGGEEPITPICSSLDSDGDISPYITDLYNCLLKHSKDIKVSEETRNLINRYMNSREPEELPFN